MASRYRNITEARTNAWRRYEARHRNDPHRIEMHRRNTAIWRERKKAERLEHRARLYSAEADAWDWASDYMDTYGSHGRDFRRCVASIMAQLHRTQLCTACWATLARFVFAPKYQAFLCSRCHSRPVCICHGEGPGVDDAPIA